MARFHKTGTFGVDDVYARHSKKSDALKAARTLEARHPGVKFDVYREEKESGGGWVYFVVEQRRNPTHARRIRGSTGWLKAKAVRILKQRGRTVVQIKRGGRKR